MEVNQKKGLLTIAYYSTAILTIVLSILFMIAMGNKEVAMWQRVIYYIWSIILILVILCDMMASCKNQHKFVVGLAITGLAFLCLIVGIIVYATTNTNGVIPFTSAYPFAIVIGFSVALTILAIVTFCTGEKLGSLKHERRTK